VRKKELSVVARFALSPVFNKRSCLIPLQLVFSYIATGIIINLWERTRPTAPASFAGRKEDMVDSLSKEMMHAK